MNGITAVVPAPADFLNVPEFVNVPAPWKGTPTIDTSLWTSHVPALLMAVPVTVLTFPAVHVAVAALFSVSVRPPVSAFVVPLRFNGPLTVVTPVPVIVPPDHRGALGIFRAYLVEPIAIFYVGVAILGTVAAVETLLIGLAAGLAVFSVIEIVTFAAAVIARDLNPGHAVAAASFPGCQSETHSIGARAASMRIWMSAATGGESARSDGLCTALE